MHPSSNEAACLDYIEIIWEEADGAVGITVHCLLNCLSCLAVG